MIKEYHFIVRPCSAPRMTRADVWKKRPAVVRYREYRDAVKLQARLMEFPDPFPHRIEGIQFLFPPAPYHSMNSRERMYGTPHQLKPDTDNILKAFMDALCPKDEVVYRIGTLEKLWADEAKIIVSIDLDNMYYGSPLK